MRLVDQLREATKAYPDVEIIALDENISPSEGVAAAMEKAKIREADIVIWGWYKKSRTSVVISSHIDLIRTFENRILKHRDDIAVQTVPDFDNFTPQLQTIEGVSFYRGGTSTPVVC